MTIDFGQCGFDYTRDLCTAIERYTQVVTNRSATAFFYRGLNLRYAVERRLYIHCINSSALFQNYLAQTGHTTSKAEELSPLEAEVAHCFFNVSQISNVEVRKLAPPYSGMRHIYRFFRRKLAYRPRPEIPTGANTSVLIHIANAKFATYLTAITDVLGKSRYVYLTTDNGSTHEQLTRLGHPSLHWCSTGMSIHGLLIPSGLTDFMDLVHEADRLLDAISRLRPSCVLTVEGNAPSDALLAEVCRKLGIPCFCLQQGWSPYVHNGFRNLRYTGMFVWGQKFADLLKPYSPGQHFIVTGSHVLPIQSPPSNIRNIISFYLQAPCALLGMAAFNDFVDLALRLIQEHPSQQFVIREHPGYSLSDATRKRFINLSNVHFSNPINEPLAELIAASLLVVSVFSTVLLEALPMNAVPIICSIGSMPHYTPDIAALGAAIEVGSVQHAHQVISGAISDPSKLDNIRSRLPKVADQFFYSTDSPNIIANHLLAAQI